MIPTKLNMNRTLNLLVLLLCLVVAGAHKKEDECPNCELCPIDDQGCCFTEDKKQISNGAHFNPNEEDPVHRHSYYNSCANFTCMDGYFRKEYYCPLAYKGIGTGCYHIGSRKLSYQDAVHYCETFGSGLAQLDAADKAVYLAKDIKPMIGELVDGDMKGVVWLGASEYINGDQHWSNGKQVKDGYTNFKGKGVDYYHIAAYSKKSYGIDEHWIYKSPYDYAYPLCQKLHCEIVHTCHYKGQEFNPGVIIWKDPKCECSWIECGEYGQIKAITKTKPCCVYNGEVFGDGENVFIDKCSKMVCKKGKLVSYPSCASEAEPDLFVAITYNGTSSCYAFLREYKTYEEAVRYCTSHDSKLAEITSKGENEAVENFLINKYIHARQEPAVDFWLGGRAEVCDNGRLGHFHWTSAESRRLPVEAVYEDFCDNQPSKDTGAHCLYTSLTKEINENYFCWANDACHKKKFVLCEKCASCEQIYKNVCYHTQENKFAHDGDLVNFGQISSHTYHGSDLQHCYEEHCENGKLITRNYVCSAEYKQVTPEVRRQGNKKNKINSLV